MIVPPDRRVNGFIFNSGAVNVQISEDATALQVLQAGAFTDGIPLAASQNIALLKWKRGLYASATSAGAQLTVILDDPDTTESLLSRMLSSIANLFNFIASQRKP